MQTTTALTLIVLWSFGQSAVSSGALTEQDLIELSSSPVWQVRYCLGAEIRLPTATARKCLEQLATDSHRGVAQQSFARYSGLFVELDRKIVNKAIERNDFALDGIHVFDPKVFASPEFWLNELDRSADDSLRGRAVRVLGFVGNASHAKVLTKYESSTNSYLLLEMALAYHRLGDSASYRRVLDRILALPTRDNIYYQNLAIACLLQTDPAKARESYAELDKRVQTIPDMQPNWMYGHVLQGRQFR